MADKPESTSAEEDGGSLRMNAIVLAIYQLTGKTGVPAIPGGLGVLTTFLGIKELTNRKKNS